MSKKRRTQKLKGKTCYLDPQIQDERFHTAVDQIEAEGGSIVADITPELSLLVLASSRKKSGRSQPEVEAKRANAAGGVIEVITGDELLTLVLPSVDEAVSLLKGSASDRQRLGKLLPTWVPESALVVEGVDLRNKDLSGLRLSALLFDNVDLRGANLENTAVFGLVRANLEGASVRGLEAYRVEHCTFDGLDLGKADLRGVSDCSFRGCDLSGVTHEVDEWERCDLRGADLFLFRPTYDRPSTTNLIGANLRQSDLMHENFAGLDLTGADLTFADLEYCDFSDTNLSQIIGVQAQFDEANLKNADLRGADLRYANFSNTDLRGAKVKGADFTGVNLHGANIEGLPLRSAKGLTAATKAIEASPKVKALATLCKKHPTVTTTATVEGEDGWRATLELKSTNKGKSFQTTEHSRTTTNKDDWGRIRVDLRTLPVALNDLLTKFRCGELVLESIRIECSGRATKGSDRIAVDAWCEAFGRAIPTDSELGEARSPELIEQRQLARSRVWLNRLATEPYAVREWNSTLSFEREGVVFSGAKFVKANLTGLELEGVDCTQSNFRSANLERASLTSCKFVGSNFSRANLQSSWIGQADFTDVNLSKAKMSKANANSTIFHAANLSGADLSGATLQCADLRGADLTGANLTDTEMVAARYNESTKLPAGFTDTRLMKWMGKGTEPKSKGRKRAKAKAESLGFDEFFLRLRKRSDGSRMAKALKMLKAERFQLFNDVEDDSVIGVVRSQSSKGLVYACRLDSSGNYTCCTQNLNACGGLSGRPCKHLLVLLVGLTKMGTLDSGKADLWTTEAEGKGPTIDKDALSEVFLKYKGVESGEIDWRPTETIPEDFYAL